MMPVARIALLIPLVACKGHKSEPHSAIPRVTAPIKIDGEWDEPDWTKRALRGPFLGDDGQLARPSSELHLLHDDAMLYVGLYAADDNIQSTDHFELEIGARKWSISAVGKLDPAVEGSAIAVDRDGTLDDASNNDEEWVIELAVPLAATGLSSAVTTLRASRCDTPNHQPQRCGSWSGQVALE